MISTQQFPHGGGMASHAGMPHGHPMGPGHPTGQAMPSGGQPGVPQMHMGANPQVSQGPMGGMGPQGGGGPGVSVGPNAHALSHLNPSAHPQLLQQQQMAQFGGNQQQQQMLRQQQQLRIQQHQQQQQQQQIMAMANHPNGNNFINNVNPAMGGMPNLPAHLQQQQMQLARQQQMQQQQQQQQHLQMQQQIALQNAQHPQSNQPNQQPHMRPPSVMGNPQDPQAMSQQQQHHQQAAQAQAQAQAVQHQPHGPQQQQPQNQQQHPQPQTQNQPQQQPGAQGQPGQGPQNIPQQGNQQHQGQPQGQPGPTGQPQHDPSTQQQMQKQAILNQAHIMNQRLGSQMRGASTLKLLNFVDQLSQYNMKNRHSNDIGYWRAFAHRFFAETGVLRQQVWSMNDGQNKTYEFTIGTIPRYYWTFFTHGVQHIQIIMESTQEKELPNGGSFVECPRATVIHWHNDGRQVMMNGTLKAQFGVGGKLEVLEHNVTEHQEYISRAKLLEQPASPDIKSSPNLTKNKKNQNRPAKSGGSTERTYTIPKSSVGEWGVPHPTQLFFEVAEVFTHMEGIFNFYSRNNHLSPPEALRQLVSSWNNNNNQGIPNEAAMGFNPAFNQQNPGQRTPGAAFGPNGPQQFQSPAPGTHLNLPVNTASPANMGMSPGMQQGGPMGQVQGNSVPMAHQPSQQGSATGSQGASANTSPHVTANNANKKRRASQVKTEADEADVNGKVKQSPRVGGKRQKP